MDRAQIQCSGEIFPNLNGSVEVDPHEQATRAKWAEKLTHAIWPRKPGARLLAAELLLMVGARKESFVGLQRIKAIMPTLGWEASVNDALSPSCEALRIVYTKLPPPQQSETVTDSWCACRVFEPAPFASCGGAP